MLLKHFFIFQTIAITLISHLVESAPHAESNCTFRTDPSFDRVYRERKYPVDYIPPDLLCVRSTPSEFRKELKEHKDEINDIKCDSCGVNDLEMIHEIIDLKNIRSLDFVNQTLKPNFQKLVNIEQFYLKLNEIPFTDELFRHNPKLKIVHIYLNYGKTLPENLFANNNELEVVYIIRCKIREIPTRLFHPLPNLRTVNFRQNKISELQPTLFEKNRKLTVLNLSYNRIMSIEKKFVDTLENLKELYLTGNPIYEIAVESIFKLNLDQFRIDHLPCVTLRDKIIPFCKFKRQYEWDECSLEDGQCLYYKPNSKGRKRIALTQVTSDPDVLTDQWIESNVDGIVCINYCGTDLKIVPETVDFVHLMTLMEGLNQTLQRMLQKHVFVVPALAALEDLDEVKRLL